MHAKTEVIQGEMIDARIAILDHFNSPARKERVIISCALCKQTGSSVASAAALRNTASENSFTPAGFPADLWRKLEGCFVLPCGIVTDLSTAPVVLRAFDVVSFLLVRHL